MGVFSGEFRSEPWMGRDAVAFLERIILPEDHILETGAGASTLWFAERAASVLSFEHKPDWYSAILGEFLKREIANATVVYDPEYPGRGIARATGPFDLIVIDGRGRVKSIETSHGQLKPGGYLCLDNANRPRYERAHTLLDGLGWEKWDIESKLIPENKRGFTTFWRKPL